MQSFAKVLLTFEIQFQYSVEINKLLMIVGGKQPQRCFMQTLGNVPYLLRSNHLNQPPEP